VKCHSRKQIVTVASEIPVLKSAKDTNRVSEFHYRFDAFKDFMRAVRSR
jgi:hypothetical protein